MSLDDEDKAMIAGLLEAALGVARKATAILTVDEAITYTKHGSQQAFSRWCQRWGVKSTTNGRYSRPQLDRAIHRESHKARFSSRRTTQKQAA